MWWAIFIVLGLILTMVIGSHQEEKQEHENKEKSYFLELGNKISDLEDTISDLENTVADLTKEIKEIKDLSQQPKYTKNKKN